MRVGIDINDSLGLKETRSRIESCGYQETAIQDADVVITDFGMKCLDHLRAGKEVIQFAWNRHLKLATGLLTDKEFKNNFRIAYRRTKGFSEISLEDTLKVLSSEKVFSQT